MGISLSTVGLPFQQNVIAQILGGAEVSLPLTHSAIPTRGSVTPSFTRSLPFVDATHVATETGQKWDDNGYLDFTALAGEMVFKGARREYNPLPSSENLTVGFTATGSTLAAGSITESGASSGHYAQTTSMVVPTNAIFQMQAEIKQSVGTRNIGIGTNSVGNAIFNPSTGVFVANDGVTLDHGTIEQTADGYWRVWVKVQATTSNKPIISLYSGTTQSYAGDGVSQVLVRKYQLNDITGETDQTTIRPYVSVGVLSAPAYHGSMVDGVKCYDTDRLGNPIATTGSYPLVGYVPWEARTNLCLQSNAFTTTWSAYLTPAPTQNVVGPDGAVSAWTLTDNDAGDVEEIYQDITLTAAAYTLSIFVKKTVGATTFPALRWFIPGLTQCAACTIDTNDGVATAWTAMTGFTMASGVSASCVSYNADYWRVALTKTGTAASHRVELFPAVTSNATQSAGAFSAAITGSAVFYGAQVELGSFATPYIPTTTVAVARNADVLTYTGADVANIKTLACTFSRGVGVSNIGTQASLDDGTVSVYATTYINGATNLVFNGITPTQQWNLSASNPYVPGVDSKVAFSMAANNILMDKDGVAQTPDTSASVPAFTKLGIGHTAGASIVNGPVNHIYGWTRNLSQSELGAIDRA
jgi:hypothetical protein